MFLLRKEDGMIARRTGPTRFINSAGKALHLEALCLALHEKTTDISTFRRSM